MKISALLVAGVCSVLLTGTFVAQQNVPKKADEAARKVGPERATVLWTWPVKNTKGEELGHLRDFLIDADKGRILYAALGYGGTLGIGEKFLAVPLKAMRLETSKDQPKERYFVLDIESAALLNYKGFSKEDWPNIPDKKFFKGEAAPANEKMRTRRATVLIGMAAKNGHGANLGTIRDLMIDIPQETVLYAALGYGGGVFEKEKLFAVPWDAITVKTLTGRAADECCVIQVLSTTLDRQGGFDSTNWPAEGDHTLFPKNGNR